ncbi:MAG: methylated-DNA--[protein]-cysteine S-methyltransferase [Gammaproteobacteria bacterium]|nr:methylated-DNA--[protein]-cysteine S-methyltransferase [Gammaproteobacteria bacterium]MDH3430746.1 methylated-DNA--[protein]-cysteine S-methyltransferase [Gammaproteobacteria bacterium]
MDRIARMQRIWDTICDIPAGSVASYGQIAEIAGIPRGARQVGHALRQLPDGQDVPWHRVLQVSGRIAFAKGSAAYKEQSKRLMMEDVTVIAGRVDMRKYRWQPDLDELLWKPSAAWDEE